MKTLNDVIAELHTTLADLQAIAAVPVVTDPDVEVDVKKESGAEETFVPGTPEVPANPAQ